MVRRALVSVHGKTGVVKFCRGLAARVLEQEHQLYPRAIRLYAEGRLQMVGRRVLVREGP
ncbi:MAG: phosphoribosylglycinamide formyltransferase, phosphoribosylglycinamide formyltransferase 1 [Candidatus Rokubacteria bacterium CSP1-6]|jgi:folate-dependent phosphoribosylglycinamide formyltransferase PurN|nr:MAG: phosphoribosylglycinamide formyltransferase, phosphoribosylglycinamide formyltransferase 1 [Candidatus Rokubacteria bacterium CSP1-6]